MGVGRLLYHIVHKQPAFRDGVDGLLHFKRSHYCSGCPSGEAAASNALNFNRSYSLHQPQDSTVSYITYNLLVNTLSCFKMIRAPDALCINNKFVFSFKPQNYPTR